MYRFSISYCPAFSCPAISCLAVWSANFMSCIFRSCIFSAPITVYRYWLYYANTQFWIILTRISTKYLRRSFIRNIHSTTCTLSLFRFPLHTTNARTEAKQWIRGNTATNTTNVDQTRVTKPYTATKTCETYPYEELNKDDVADCCGNVKWSA